MSAHGGSIEDIVLPAIARLFSVPEPQTIEAGDQLIRSRMDPRQYATLVHIDNQLAAGGPRRIRHIAERAGYEPIIAVIPEAASFMERYQRPNRDVFTGDYETDANAYRLLALLAAAIDSDWFEELSTATARIAARDAVQERIGYAHRNRISEREWSDALERIRQFGGMASTPAESQKYLAEPVHSLVRRDEDGSEVAIRLPLYVHIADPQSHSFSVSWSAPQVVHRIRVDGRHRIPWNALTDGLHIECTLRDAHGALHVTESFTLEQHQLEQIRENGTAVTSRIGFQDDIHFYPEYMPSGVLPIEHSLVSLRVSQAHIEIARLDPNIGLTVWY